MAYKNENYHPNMQGAAILERAMEHVKSVSYHVSARWLFSRLLQDGIYHSNADYQRFLSLTSRARHNHFGDWRPDTLTDETREAIERGWGYATPTEWAKSVSIYGVTCHLDKWRGQAAYVEIWYEANAMTSQFTYHTRYITLVPFGGMPSIPYKWEAAKRLEAAAENHGLPVKVLYFGDLDQAGETIPQTSMADIQAWCSVPIEFIRAGLNPGDEVRYHIPENFEHPGAYQWEALDATVAGELIRNAVAAHVDTRAMDAITRDEVRAERALTAYLRQWPGLTAEDMEETYPSWA